MQTVSIIMPVHNAQATLDDSIRSVLAQDYAEWELLIVDDGSTDDSIAIALEAARHDQRICVLSQENGGPSTARNLGLRHANGEIIAFLDADDLWQHDKLATHISLFNFRPEIDMSFARIQPIDGNGKPCARRSRMPRGPLALEALLASNPACTSSNLVARKRLMDRIGGFDERLHHAEDQELMVRALMRGARIEAINCTLVRYRVSTDSASANLEAMLSGWQRMIAAIPGLDGTTLAQAQATYHRYLARQALRTGRPLREAFAHLRRALAPRPSDASPLVQRSALGSLAHALRLPFAHNHS
ncbi:MAG: glycosyltransferase [Pseudomonadota bacterium]